jgi:hypothetical protein
MGWWPRTARSFVIPPLFHLVLAVWLFSGPLLQGRVLYFRDITYYFHPSSVFVEHALRQGIWPLWNPMAQAGAPFLLSYPVDLGLLVTVGARATLAVGPPLHILIGMWGACTLGRRLGMGRWGAWVAGATFGASGYMLSLVNLVPLLEGASWAPWILAAFLSAFETPSLRRIAVLAVLGALQLSTLAGEIVLQTAVMCVVLMPRKPSRRVVGGLGAAAVLALLLAAPTLLGASTLLENTERSLGFARETAFAFSASHVVLLESILPRLFGNMHSFSNVGYWGQSFFPAGYPYLLSLYLGLPLVLLALRSRFTLLCAKLWALVAFGALVSLGSHGPLKAALVPLFTFFRVPVKFFFFSTLSLCLLAGLGLDRAIRDRTGCRPWFFVPGSLLLLVGAALWAWPGATMALLGRLAPALRDPRAREVMTRFWVGSFLLSGLLAAATALVLRGGARLRFLSGVVVVVDLLLVNDTLNPSTSPGFYALRPALAELVDGAKALGSYRWFSYGVANSPPVRWKPEVAYRNSDAWLYYVDRQCLWGWTGILDGIEGAFDEDRTGWAPLGSSLSPLEVSGTSFRDLSRRFRLANVRWILSFPALPEDLVSLRGSVALPEIEQPLGLYEMRDPLPRAFWVPRCEVVAEEAELRRRLEDPGFDPRQVVLLQAPPAGTGCQSAGVGTGWVSYERPDPHTIRLKSTGAQGFIVVVEGFHRFWKIEGEAGTLSILPANGRYWAIPTRGGDRTIVARYEPSWRAPALAACLLAAVLVIGGCHPGAGRLWRRPSRP